MGKDGSFDIAVSSTAPTDSDTTTLFNSETSWGLNCLSALDVKRISFGVRNSHAGTLKAYEKSDGTNWRQFDSQSVGAAASTAISGPYDYLIDTYKNFKLDWVNGGTTQTTWDPVMHGHENRVPGT